MNPFDHQKHPVVQSLNWFAEEKIRQAESMLAKSMPASVVEVDKSGTIVTVKIEVQSGYKFPKIQCPVYGPQYVRWPIQKGDKGCFLSADYYLGGMSGLGGGVAELGPCGNISTGVWFPIGNMGFDPTDDPNKVVLYGPDGVILKTTAKDKGKIDVGPDAVNISYGPKLSGVRTETDAEGFKVYVNNLLKLIVDANGIRFLGGGGGNFGINITDHGTFIDNVNFLPHTHTGVQSGSGNTGVVNP
jgi:hypothetical protein